MPHDRSRHTVSPGLASFVGRERELAAAAERVRSAGVRLVSLTGPPGIGKTRLALRLVEQIAPELRDGAAVVSLEAVHDASLVPAAIASALGLPPAAGSPAEEQIADWLSSRQVVLFLDNFEQVIDAAALLPTILERAPEATCLVTTREALDVRGEHEVPVPPLPVPDLERFDGVAPQALVPTLSQYASVRLFCARARAVDPGFHLNAENALAIASACRRLDGIPLALELAASRLKVMSLEALGRQLEQTPAPGLLNVLGRGPRDSPRRQQTLVAAIDWSYQLLTPREQRLFRALAVFADGWTLETAGRMMEDLSLGLDPTVEPDPMEAMALLAGKSLVHRHDAADGTQRWSMLQALRSYALTCLRAAAEEWREVHEWQYRWALGLLDGSDTASLEGLDDVEAERGNVRGVLEWAIAEGDGSRALRLGAMLWRFWLARTHLTEGRLWLQRILERPALPRDPLHARVLHGAAMLARQQGDIVGLREYLARALELLASLPHEDGTAVAIASASADLGLALALDGRPAEAARFVDEGLAVLRDAGVSRELAIGLRAKGTLTFLQGHPQEGAELLTEALAICRTIGDRILEGDTLESIGLVLADTDRRHARAAAAEGLALHEAAGYPRGIAKGLAVLGSLACADGELPSGEAQLRRALALFGSVGERVYVSYCLVHLASAASLRGDQQEAVRLAGAAQAFSDRRGAMFPFIAARHRTLVDSTRASLGEPAFEGAWAEGRALAVPEIAAAASGADAGRARDAEVPPADLTPREAEVLALVAAGLSNSDIADRIFVSARTVHAHLRSIYGKLGVPNRTAAARYATEHGLVASAGEKRNSA